MWHEYNKNDTSVRVAIWKIYGKKDHYTGSPIEFRELEVDHIIPQELFKDENELFKVLDELGVPRDFKKDCLENYLPTRRGPNSSKGDITDPVLTRHSLITAKKHVDEIIKEINKYKSDEDIITLAAKIATGCKQEEDKEIACDVILDEVEPFEENSLKDGYYYITKSQVSLKAHLAKPEQFLSENSLRTNCTLEFRALKARNSLIHIDEEEILKNFFEGVGDKEPYSRRPYIYKNDCSYTVSIGNAIFPLGSKATEELCEIIDEFVDDCIKGYKDVEACYSGLLINKHNELVLYELSEYDYIRILESINTIKNEPDWNIFESNQDVIKICTEGNVQGLNDGYHAILYARKKMSGDMFSCRNKVYLCMAPYPYNNGNTISDKDWWDADRARKWIEGVLCKKIESKTNKIKLDSKIGFFNKKDACTGERIQLIFPEEKYHAIEIEPNIEKIKSVVKALQTYFSNKKRIMDVSADCYNKMYNALIELTKSINKQNCLLFVGKKLGIERDYRNVNGIIDHISAKCRNRKDSKIDYSEVDLLLRCFIEEFDNGEANVDISQIRQIANSLQVLVDEYNFYLFRDKMLFSLE